VLLGIEFFVYQQWMAAIKWFYIILVITTNLGTYNVSGILLIRILRLHERTGLAAVAEISTSKSTSPFSVVIAKTIRSMLVLTIPSLAILLLYLVAAIGNCNTKPVPVYNPNALTWTTVDTLFVQLVLGLVFTRFVWISRATLDAEILTRTVSMVSSEALTTGTTPEGARSSRALSKADMKDKARKMSQSPKPRTSKGRPSVQTSQLEVEMPQETSPLAQPPDETCPETAVEMPKETSVPAPQPDETCPETAVEMPIETSNPVPQPPHSDVENAPESPDVQPQPDSEILLAQIVADLV